MKIPTIKQKEIIKAYYFKKVKIPKTLDKDLAYFAGILRDGVVTARGKEKGEYTIEIYQKNIEFLKKVIVPLVKKLFGIETEVKYQRHGKFVIGRIRMYSKMVYTFIKEAFEHPETSGQKTCWKTPSIIMKSNSELQKSYMQGFFDAEGHVSKDLKVIVIGQAWDKKSKSPLDDMKQMLEKLSIRSSLITYFDKRPNRKPMKILKIAKKDSIFRFAKDVGSKHPEKLKRFKKILDLSAPVLVAK